MATYNVFKKYSNSNTRTSSKTTRGKSKKTLKPKMKKILYILIGIVFFIGCIGLLGVGIYLKNIQKSLPSPDELVTRTSDESTQILDRNGSILYTIYGNQNREFVAIENIPEKTKWAFLSAEDIEFYQHKGVDYKGILRSVINNLKAGSITGSGSTITQQLVKTTILYDILGDQAYAQTYTRKIKEILITMQVEQTFTKDQILQMYLNEVPLGGVNYGLQAAANAYFGKDVSELDLAESAIIAGVIQSPGIYSPLYGTNPDMAKERQTYVLDQMLKHKELTGVTEEEIQAAKDEELVYSTKKIDIKAPHFVFYVKQLLVEKYGIDRVEKGGLKVTTTLDYPVQEIAEEEISQGVDNAKKNNINNGSMVVMDPNNGQVLAMVGSVDYWNIEDPRVDGNVNIALSQRQMGSSIKPFVYLTAIEQGYGPWTEAPDLAEIKFGTYDPKNWDSKNSGTMTARKALVYSRNVPAVYTLQMVGIDNFLQTAETVGITSLANKAAYGLSLALGSGEETLLEHATAYTVLANGGTKYDVSPILKVEDSNGEVLEELKETKGKRVYAEKDIYAVNWMLCDLGGFNDRPDNGYYTVNGKRVCGKTGTTDGPKDLTTIIYHQNLVVAVWNGNNNGEVAPGAWGSTIPLRIANSFVKRVADRYVPESYSRPAGVLSTTVCTDTGATPGEGVTCKKEASIYLEGSAPPVDNRKTVEICKANNLIPDNLSAAQKYGLTSSKVLITTKLGNTLQQGAFEKYLLGMKKSVYLISEPATGTCPLPLGPDNSPIVDISTPTATQSVEAGSNVEITGSVSFLESISDFSVKFDGNNIAGATMQSNGTYLVTYVVPSSTGIGAHTITVTATDNYGKTDSTSVSINVVAAGSGITLSILSPTGGTVGSSTQITVAPSGGSVDSVSIKIVKSGTTIGTYAATSSGANWVYTWNVAASGTYTITATALKGSTTITSPTVTVTR
ncbi:transglycosylase domain-containing protein [Patescibacteria group bacterium]|nr:transglycosylase domain-containing protein [Patescibacteria group bacterium]